MVLKKGYGLLETQTCTTLWACKQILHKTRREEDLHVATLTCLSNLAIKEPSLGCTRNSFPVSLSLYQAF